MNNIKNIELSRISPDPRNPRKKFSEEAIKELADNIVQQGLLQPITVRPTEWWDEVSEEGEIISVPCRFQVVCGERRFRAYKKLHNEENLKKQKYSLIPAIVREMDDNEAFDAMITENLIRKDVNPAEEGRAFVELKKRMSIKEIAQRFGKSEQFVRQRLQLSDLIFPLAKMLEEETLPVSYALTLSRFSPEMQSQIYDDCLQDVESSLFPRSLKALSEYIERKYMMYLDKAMFDTKAGDMPCHRCTDNTSNQRLFEEYKGDDARCTNRSCFAKKQEQAIVEIAKDMHKAGYIIVLQDVTGSAVIRERLDALNIGYSTHDYRLRTDKTEPGDNEVKAVLLYNYRGYQKQEGVMYMDAQQAAKSVTKTNAERILDLKKEDDNNLRIKDENTTKEVRAFFASTDYHLSASDKPENEQVMYAVMMMDLSQHYMELLGLDVKRPGTGSDIVFERAKSLTAEQKAHIQRCWVQYKLDNSNTIYDRATHDCLHELCKVHYPNDYNEIVARYEHVYNQRKNKIEEQFSKLGISLEDLTADMIAEYEAKYGKGDDKAYRKGKKEYLKIVSRVTKDNAARLADIQKKYGFKSNYEISQYLMHCFLRVADPDNDPIMDPVPEEIVDMFGDLSDYGSMRFEKPKRRIPTNTAE